MAELYQSLFSINNIHTAIINTLKQDNCNLAGPDGIVKSQLLNNNQVINEISIIKQVKKRLRRCAILNYRIVNNNIISNLYDRIAQQCVYQVINSIISSQFSIHNYRINNILIDNNAVIKTLLSRICSTIINTHGVYIIKIDFSTKWINEINILKIINILISLGINDKKLLCTIKYLLWPFININIDINQLNNFQLLIFNCYLYYLDKWAENNIEFNSKTRNTRRDLNTYSNNYMEWLKKHNKKPHAKYYRYNNILIILTSTRSEQLYIYDQLNIIIKNELININKIKLNYNALDVFNFHIKRMRDINTNIWKINITPSNIQQLHMQIKQLNFRSPIECLQSIKIILQLFNYYDITNNLAWLIELIDLRMRRHTDRTGSCLKLVWNDNNKEYEYMFYYCKHQFNICIWKLRRIFKISYKEYIINPQWLIKRNNINNIMLYTIPYQLKKWELWTKQKGKDYCTGYLMNPKQIHIHHIDGNRLNNQIDNLILISKTTHDLIHNNKPTNNKKILAFRKKLKNY